MSQEIVAPLLPKNYGNYGGDRPIWRDTLEGVDELYTTIGSSRGGRVFYLSDFSQAEGLVQSDGDRERGWARSILNFDYT